ncbi:MAG: hypothetical protein DWQ07_17840 [Chloroflexi bacterium]|nr:MAG: hypothetical protein DWQ07_17840 [Chloroflexota bacterium]
MKADCFLHIVVDISSPYWEYIWLVRLKGYQRSEAGVFDTLKWASAKIFDVLRQPSRAVPFLICDLAVVIPAKPQANHHILALFSS